MLLPRQYRGPDSVHTIEWYDDEGRSLGQAGAFYSMAMAVACLAELEAKPGNDNLVINTVPVHHRIDDWRFDR